MAATDTARGLLMLRPMLSLDTVTATAVDMAMAATAVDMVATTARGLLMPSLRLRPRLSLDTVMATAVDGYGGYGRRYGGYYGKRSADAEPEADAVAEAEPGYGYRGGYGGYGYGR